jgi:leucyl aminopeptidase
MAHEAFTVDQTDAATIHAVGKEGFSTWLEAQPDATRGWLASSRFAGEPGSLTWLSDGDVLCIVGDEAISALADLPLRLAEGDYRLDEHDRPDDALLACLGWGLGAYQFSRYKSPKRKPARLVLPPGVDGAVAEDHVLAAYLVRDLINTPANDMLPEQLAIAADGLATSFGADISVAVGDDLLRDNHPTIHAVGRASECAPRLIDLNWGDPNHPRVTLVGKGVCFDSGGLDLKPAAGMRLMKKDMGGAAHVLGLARLIMSQQLPVRLRVLVPAVENAVSANAYRPGDILTTRKGLTVEIDNTDAEGRLVLCDALALAAEDKPELMIDFATLTGAARSALGTDVPAMFTNTDDVADGIFNAGNEVADPVWRLPLHQPYRRLLESRAADLVNSAASPYGGAITAALFLESFVDETPWVHFDLMAWNTTKRPGRPEGGEAMGLRAVFGYLEQRFRQGE